jgi:hypothetical protein
VWYTSIIKKPNRKKNKSSVKIPPDDLFVNNVNLSTEEKLEKQFELMGGSEEDNQSMTSTELSRGQQRIRDNKEKPQGSSSRIFDDDFKQDPYCRF